MSVSPAGSSGLGSPLGRSRHSSSQSDLSAPSSSSSGLSFTACMSDFSLYVFHPYGAGKQKTAVSGLTAGSGALGTPGHSPLSRRAGPARALTFPGRAVPFVGGIKRDRKLKRFSSW